MIKKASIVKASGIDKSVNTAFCLLSVLWLQVDWSKTMECMRRDTAAVIHACDMIAQDETARAYCLLREIGVDGIFYSIQNAELRRPT